MNGGPISAIRIKLTECASPGAATVRKTQRQCQSVMRQLGAVLRDPLVADGAELRRTRSAPRAHDARSRCSESDDDADQIPPHECWQTSSATRMPASGPKTCRRASRTTQLAVLNGYA